MHSLHRLLIDITDVPLDDNMSKEEQINQIREYALINSEAQGYAYDWRTETDAGRWSKQYPDNLILGRDNPQFIIDEVKFTRIRQDKEMKNLLCSLRENNLNTIEDLFETIKSQDGMKYSSILSYIQGVANLLSGEYASDSFFLFVNHYNPIVCDYIVEQVTNDPSRFAILFIDCHW